MAAGFATKNIVIVAGITELNHLFVLYNLTVLVYTKTTILLSVDV